MEKQKIMPSEGGKLFGFATPNLRGPLRIRRTELMQKE
jgi:hypothetical protein